MAPEALVSAASCYRHLNFPQKFTHCWIQVVNMTNQQNECRVTLKVL